MDEEQEVQQEKAMPSCSLCTVTRFLSLGTGGLTMAGDGIAYPKRTAYFAHRYCRLLTKTCAAQEIGHIAFTLCVTIAHVEDAKRYTGPVAYFNDQLQPIIGVTKWETLDTARKKAVEAGWLYYENRGKRRPGRYWVMMPPQLEGLPDSPCDESLYPLNGDKGGGNNGLLCPPQGDKGGDNAGDNAGDKGGDKGGDPFLPIPKPIPTPKFSSAGPTLAEVLEVWNAIPGVEKARAESTKRKTAFRQRRLDKMWLENWQQALALVAASSFCQGGGDRGWRANLDWFLAPDTVVRVIEGRYGDRKDGKASSSGGPVESEEHYA